MHQHIARPAMKRHSQEEACGQARLRVRTCVGVSIIVDDVFGSPDNDVTIHTCCVGKLRKGAAWNRDHMSVY